MTDATTQALVKELSSREREVAARLGRGLKQPRIAVDLAISKNTVAQHIFRAKKKLGLHSTAQLAEYARNAGWC